jgi:putative methyltransferase (TIGR04325 family)
MGTTMDGMLDEGLRARLIRLISESAQLPGVRLLSRPLYRHIFRRPVRGMNNLYYGVFDNFAAAKQQANALSTQRLPSTYNVESAGRMYRGQLQQPHVSDYAAMFWLQRMLNEGARKVFDLGGHIGLAYYIYEHLMNLPADIDWCVHDVPLVMQTGREWAREHDPSGRLRFANDLSQADGCDLLISSGALQYMDYSLPELLQRLRVQPTHVLVNRTPMHPNKRYFTLQNLGIAICPYRVESIEQTIDEMHHLGYTLQGRWDLLDRHLRIPFHRGYAIDRYYGFYFKQTEKTV